jgi:hypothetical protein
MSEQVSAARQLGLDYLAAAKARFKDKLIRIEVPDFAEEGVPAPVVYARPLTIADRAAIQAKAKDDPFEQAVYVVQRHALDEHGDNLFTVEDLRDFRRNVRGELVEALAARINAELGYEAAKKNSQTTPKSSSA